MKNGLLREALRIAREKLPGHPQFSYWPHYCFIIQNNSIIDWGYNTTQEPPIHFGYTRQLDGGKSKTHAELNAYKAAKGLINKNKAFEIINIRLSRLGNLRTSQPCGCCVNFLRSVGCQSCYFSSEVWFSKVSF